jgi:hypothetical protein
VWRRPHRKHSSYCQVLLCCLAPGQYVKYNIYLDKIRVWRFKKWGNYSCWTQYWCFVAVVMKIAARLQTSPAVSLSLQTSWGQEGMYTTHLALHESLPPHSELHARYISYSAVKCPEKDERQVVNWAWLFASLHVIFPINVVVSTEPVLKRSSTPFHYNCHEASILGPTYTASSVFLPRE